MSNSNSETIHTQRKSKSYLLGAIGAILGALIGAIPWAIAYYFGWFVGWLGMLIGFCAKKGYELFGGKIGRPKIWIICITTILGVIVGNIAGDFLEIGSWIVEGEAEGFTFLDIPSLFVYLLSEDSEILKSFLTNLGLGFVFGGIAIGSVFKEIKAEVEPEIMGHNFPEQPNEEE